MRGAKVVVVKPAKVLKVVGKNLGDGDAATGNDSATDLDTLDPDIFADGFEANDYCAWSGVHGAPPCS